MTHAPFCEVNCVQGLRLCDLGLSGHPLPGKSLQQVQGFYPYLGKRQTKCINKRQFKSYNSYEDYSNDGKNNKSVAEPELNFGLAPTPNEAPTL